MYKHFFGLRENPFNINPDPRYLFLTPQTQKALDQLTYGIQTRQGLILLTGEVGTGKTTVINRLRAWLHQQQTPTAFIFNSHLGTGDLFDCMLADFAVPPAPQLNGNAPRLNQWLLSRYRAGELPVLIVDEAQGLPTDVLEEIRMLLNWETPGERLLQIVLAGQPELETRLKCPELRQLKQRIAFRCKTAALTLQETHDYIQSRLKTAGARGEQIFASQTIQAVYFYSRGIPRVINLLCEHALINAYVDGVRLVPAQSIAEIAHDLQFDDEKYPSSIDAGVAGWPDASIEQSINSDSPNNDIALHLTDALDSPVRAGATTGTPGLHRVAGPDADGGAISSASIHAWTIFDGNKNGIRVNQMNVASGRQWLAELTTARPLTVQTPRIASRKINTTSKLWRASCHTWNRTFDKRALYQFASDAKSQVVCNARRLRPMIGRLGLLLQDAAAVLCRTALLLVSWRSQTLVQQYAATPEAQNPPAAAITASTAFSRRFGRSWDTWRSRCLSAAPIASTLRVGQPLLRWLREPMRPAQLRAPSRR
jgi:general secretion pathway protein A